MSLRKGYGVFGKEYEFMFINDLHDKNSIDYVLLRNMVLIDNNSIHELYDFPLSINENINKNELYQFAQTFKGASDMISVQNVLDFTSGIVRNYSVPFENMFFGGTEKQIIDRGTDWCSDISRVGCVLLQCLNIPARIGFLVNRMKAYNGHTVGEAFIDSNYVLCDFTYGVVGFSLRFYSIKKLLNNPEVIKKIYFTKVNETVHLEYICNLFDEAAISEYDCSKSHLYNISTPNEYYLELSKIEQDGLWHFGE